MLEAEINLKQNLVVDYNDLQATIVELQAQNLSLKTQYESLDKKYKVQISEGDSLREKFELSISDYQELEIGYGRL